LRSSGCAVDAEHYPLFKELPMPILDMPLAKLKTYKGMNPRPKDFDVYWDKALREMGSVDPKVKLTPDKTIQVSYAEFFDLHWTGVGGARIHAKLKRPKKPTGPAIVAFHGYSMSAGDWSDHLGFVAQGFTVAAMDCRGQGGYSEEKGGVKGTTLRGHIIRGLDDHPQSLLFRQIYLDTAQLSRIVMGLPGVDKNRVGALGASQGGGLTLACAALEPRIRRIAPCYPFLSDYQRVWDMDLAKDAYEELRYYFRSFDPFHKREKEIFTRLGYIDVQHLAPRIEAETLMAITLMDPICPPSTQFAAYNKIKSKKQMALYPDYGHEYLREWGDKSFQFMLGL
jgi:cephalosporin-C deacetylase